MINSSVIQCERRDVTLMISSHALPAKSVVCVIWRSAATDWTPSWIHLDAVVQITLCSSKVHLIAFLSTFCRQTLPFFLLSAMERRTIVGVFKICVTTLNVDGGSAASTTVTLDQGMPRVGGSHSTFVYLND